MHGAFCQSFSNQFRRLQNENNVAYCISNKYLLQFLLYYNIDYILYLLMMQRRRTGGKGDDNAKGPKAHLGPHTAPQSPLWISYYA